MHASKISTRQRLFWLLCLVLISGTSTVIFSESWINDSFGSTLIILCLVGFLIYGAQRLFEQINDICNP